MGQQPSSIARDSLYPEDSRLPENRGKFAGRDPTGVFSSEQRRPIDEPPASASASASAPTAPRTAGKRILNDDERHRRQHSIDGQDGLTTEAMQDLSAELHQRPPTWEYRIDEYGKVAKRTRTPTVQKLKEEPLVPLGVLGTIVILFMASREFQRGDSRQMNRYLWWRVYAQGATIGAMVVGSIYYESTRAERAEREARDRGWPVEEMRERAGWTADGSERLSGRRPPSFWDPFRRVRTALWPSSDWSHILGGVVLTTTCSSPRRSRDDWVCVAPTAATRVCVDPSGGVDAVCDLQIGEPHHLGRHLGIHVEDPVVRDVRQPFDLLPDVLDETLERDDHWRFRNASRLELDALRLRLPPQIGLVRSLPSIVELRLGQRLALCRSGERGPRLGRGGRCARSRPHQLAFHQAADEDLHHGPVAPEERVVVFGERRRKDGERVSAVLSLVVLHADVVPRLEPQIDIGRVDVVQLGSQGLVDLVVEAAEADDEHPEV